MKLQDLVLVTEAFDTVYPYKWTHNYEGMKQGDFTVDGRLYRVSMVNMDGSWVVSYGLKPDRGTVITKPTELSGSAGIKILSTVIAMVKDFMANNQVDHLSFTGKNDNGLANLYKKMVSHFSKTFDSVGYQLSTQTGELETKFNIYRR